MNERDNLTESNPSTSEKALRKSKSFRSLRYEWLSSAETLSSEKYSDSIYNAEPVLSNENLPEVISPIGVVNTDQATSPGPVLSPALSPRNPHSQWPIPQLSTIIEQNSIQTLRPSRSAPRMRESPEKYATIVHPKTSDHSLHSLVHTNTAMLGSPEASLYQARSLSMNNIDTILKQELLRAAEPHSSSNSDRTIDTTLLPQYPLRPSQMAPYRAPTPPGLPSFGSPEAQTFRLTPDQPRSLWSRFWGSSAGVIADPAQSTNSMASPSVDSDSPSVSPQVSPTTPSSEVFRRTLAMMGMSRIVTPPSTTSQYPRASLPPGIHISVTPGPLVQAEDGTFIRGRFHSRHSGHGIGNRALESHPLVRRSQSDRWSVIEEQVQAIDKACQRADREALQETRSMSSPGRARGRTHRQSGTDSSGIPSMTMTRTPDADGVSLRGSTQSGPRLANILEDRREQSMLHVGDEKPKQSRVSWRRLCLAMGCCCNFWFWWCCGCQPDPIDVPRTGVSVGVNPERTLLYR